MIYLSMIFVIAVLIIAVVVLCFLKEAATDESTWFADCNKQLLKENDAVRKRNDHLEGCQQSEMLWEVGMMKAIGTDSLGGVKEAIQAHKNVIRRISVDIEKQTTTDNRAVTVELLRIRTYLREFVESEINRVNKNSPEYFRTGRQL